MPDTLRVLYVDDEADLLQIGKLFLEDMGGFSVTICLSAKEGLLALASTPYDAIISDYQMPRMDGITFLKEVRGSGNTTPFILFTGRGREEIVIQALNEGADFYLQKGGDPVAQFTELAHKIRQAVQGRRAEVSIRDHERREADIINFLPDATFAIDASGTVIAWNRAMEDFSGRLAHEMLGKGNYEYSIPIYGDRRPILIDFVLNDYPDIEKNYPYILRSGKKLFSEIYLPHKNNGNGAFIWFTASPLYDTQGNIAGAIESIRDITDRKRNEEETAFKNLILSTQQETSLDAILIVDKNGRILQYNHKFVEIWNVPDNLVGTGSPDEPLLRYVTSQNADPESFLARVRYLYEHPDEKSFEILLLKDGRTIERHSAPMMDTAGNYYGRVWYFRDISERKRAEDALSREKTFIDAIFNSVPGMIYLYDADGALIRWNRNHETMTGYSAEELSRMHLFDWYKGDGKSKAAVTEGLERTMRTGFGDAEALLQKKDGTTIPMYFTASPLTINGNKYFTGIGIDITDRKKTEAALCSANAMFSRTQEIAHVGSWQYTPATSAVEWSDETYRIFGQEPGKFDVTLENIRKLMHPMDLEMHDRILARGIKSGVYEPQVYRIYLQDGTVRSIQSVAEIITDPSGAVVQIRGSVQDITDRKKADDALRESREQLALAIEGSGAGLWDWRVQTGETIFNERWAQIIGYSLAELQPVSIRTWTDHCHSEDLKRSNELLEKHFRGESPKYEIELRMRHKSGHWVWVLDQGKVTEWDDDGKPVRMTGTHLDITDRKQADEAIRQSEERYRSVIDNIQDIFYRTDENGRLVMASPSWARVLGYDSTDECVGKSIAETFYYDPAQREVFLQEIRRNGHVENFTTVLRKKNGNPVYVSTNSHLYYHPDGSFAGVEGIIRDISALKQAEEETAKKSRALEIMTEIITAANGAGNLKDLLDTILDSALRLLSFEAGGIYLVNEENRTAVLANFRNLPDAFAKTVREIPIDQAPYTTLFEKGDPIFTDHYREDFPDRTRVSTFLSLASIPLVAGNRIIGALNVASTSRATITPDDRQILISTGRELGSTISRMMAEESLRKKTDELHGAYEQIAASEEELRANFEELSHQEKIIRESAKRLADIIEFLPDATFAIDMSGKVIAWNQAIETLSGVPKSAILGKGGYEYALWLYQERRPILIDLVLNYDPEIAGRYPVIRNEGDRLFAEVHIPHLHGSKGGYLWFTASPLYDPEGNLTGAIESIREITEHKDREAALNRKNEELASAYEELTSSEEELRQQVEEIAATWNALKASEDRYRNVVEDQTEFISRFTPDGIHVFVNGAYCRYFGIARESVLGHRFRPAIHPDDRARVDAFFRSLTAENPVGTIEHRIVMPDGSVRWQWWSDRAIFDKTGKIIEYQSVGRDITDHKKTEEALLQAAGEYTSLLENIQDVYFRTDMNGNLVRASTSLARLFGYASVSECLGRPVAETFYVDPEDRMPFVKDVLRTGEVSDYGLLLKKKDGTPVPISTNSHACYNHDGTLVGIEGTFRDMTERNRQTDCIREAEQRMTDIINFLPDPTFVIDRQGTVIAWNRAIEEMTGCPAASIIGRGDHEYAVPFYGERRPILIDLVFTHDPAIEGKYSMIRRAGEILTAETCTATIRGRDYILWGKAGPLYDARGEVSGAIESIRDITDRHMMEQSLKNLNKKLSLLGSITRHDINNQLTKLLAFIRMLEKSLPEPRSEYLQKIASSAQLISAMIQFTRQYEEIGVSAAAWQDLREVCNNAVSGLVPPEITVINDIPEGTEILADPLIGKVFFNLVDNAMRYGKTVRTIRFSSRMAGLWLVVSCADDGIGIPEDEKEMIFMRGYGKNTGLGLALSREILDITGISIAETGTPGKGAQFDITIPAGAFRLMNER